MPNPLPDFTTDAGTVANRATVPAPLWSLYPLDLAPHLAIFESLPPACAAKHAMVNTTLSCTPQALSWDVRL